MSNLSKKSREFEQLLRLRTSPLAFKRCQSVKELESIPKIRRPKHQPTFCQILTLSRTLSWNIGVTENEVFNCTFPQRAGLLLIPDDAWKKRVGTWLGTMEDGERWLGGAEEDELDIALHPTMMEAAKELASMGLTYPIHRMGSEANPFQHDLVRTVSPQEKPASRAGGS